MKIMRELVKQKLEKGREGKDLNLICCQSVLTSIYILSVLLSSNVSCTCRAQLYVILHCLKESDLLIPLGT